MSCFLPKGMIWDVKPHGQSWNADYFRNNILKRKVIPFITNEDNVYGDILSTPVMLHDMAGCFRAKATHDLLDRHDIDYFRAAANDCYPRWGGNSPDCNPAENMGAIVMDKCEVASTLEEFPDRRETITRVLNTVLSSLEFETELFENLLLSFWDRMLLVKEKKGHALGKY